MKIKSEKFTQNSKPSLLKDMFKNECLVQIFAVEEVQWIQKLKDSPQTIKSLAKAFLT